MKDKEKRTTAIELENCVDVKFRNCHVRGFDDAAKVTNCENVDLSGLSFTPKPGANERRVEDRRSKSKRKIYLPSRPADK